MSERVVFEAWANWADDFGRFVRFADGRVDLLDEFGARQVAGVYKTKPVRVRVTVEIIEREKGEEG